MRRVLLGDQQTDEDLLTSSSNKDFQISFAIPMFKEHVFRDKVVKQSKPIRNDFESRNLEWTVIIGVIDKPDQVCYARLQVLSRGAARGPNTPISYSFGLKYADGVVDCKTGTIRTTLSDLVTTKGCEIDFFTKSKFNSNEKRVVVDTVVTVVCQITIGDVDKETPTIKKHLEQVLHDELLSDVRIITDDGEIILAHKAMLVRSPAFYKLLKHDMIPKKIEEIRVENISAATFREVLKFIYTGKVNDLESAVGDLLIAAFTYDLLDLKEVCKQALEDHVTFDNFAQSLKIATRYKIESLKAAVLRFAVANRLSIGTTEGWKKLKADKELHETVAAAFMNSSL